MFFQTLLGSLLIPLTFLLSRLFLPRRGVFLTVVMVALSPHLITMTSYLLSETLLSFAIIAAITAYVYACKRESLLLFVSAGLLFGASYLTNEIVLPIPLLLALVTHMLLRKSAYSSILSKFRKSLIIGTLTFLFFPAGWMLRNNLNVPADSANGTGRALATLSHGAYPGFIYKNPAFKYQPYREDPEQPEFSSSLKSFRKIFSRRFRERPLRYLSWYLLEKPYHLWTWKMTQGYDDLYVYAVRESLFTKSAIANYFLLIMKALHYCWMLLCLMGFFALIRSRKKEHGNLPVILLFSVLIYGTVIYTVFAPWSRYAVPFRPIFYGIGTWALCLFLSHIKIGTGLMSDSPEIPFRNNSIAKDY